MRTTSTSNVVRIGSLDSVLRSLPSGNNLPELPTDLTAFGNNHSRSLRLGARSYPLPTGRFFITDRNRDFRLNPEGVTFSLSLVFDVILKGKPSNSIFQKLSLPAFSLLHFLFIFIP